MPTPNRENNSEKGVGQVPETKDRSFGAPLPTGCPGQTPGHFSPQNPQPPQPSTCMTLVGCGEGREERGGSSRPWWGREQVGGGAGGLKVIKEGKQPPWKQLLCGKYHRWALLIAWGDRQPRPTCQGRETTGSRLAPAEQEEVPGPPTGGGAPASRTSSPVCRVVGPQRVAQPDRGLVH